MRSKFEQYVEQVDFHLQEHLGFGIDSLDPDTYDFESAYTEGLTVSEAAERAVLAAEGN